MKAPAWCALRKKFGRRRIETPEFDFVYAGRRSRARDAGEDQRIFGCRPEGRRDGAEPRQRGFPARLLGIILEAETGDKPRLNEPVRERQ